MPETRFFVILNGGNNLPLAMTSGDGDIAVFDSREDAEAHAEANMIGQARGYEVYEWLF